MRILHVADLHYRTEWFRWIAGCAAEFDLIVIGGDLVDFATPNTLLAQRRWISEWIDSFSTPVAACSGNHDAWHDPDAPDPHWPITLARPGRVVVDNQRLDIGGLTIAVLPWTEPVLPVAPTHIVVVHSPPFGTATSFAPNDAMDHGDRSLAEQLANSATRPWLMLCGHVHRPRRWYSELGLESVKRTWVLNPGCDPRRRIPTHIVIDTEKLQAARVHELRTDLLYLKP